MKHQAVLVGCGRISERWLDAITAHPLLKDKLEIVGLVDIDPLAVRSRAAQFGLSGARIGTDLDAMLAATKPDVVFDVALPAAREEIVATSLQHGAHVLSEKPLAETPETAMRIVDLARSAGRIHAVIQNRRFVSGVRRIRRAIKTGIIGDLTALHCDFFMGIHFEGFRQTMDHVLLLDMSIHTFDAARFMAGLEPSAVYCLENNPRGSSHAHGAAVDAIFEFGKDVVFNYRGSFSAEGANTSWEGAWRIIGSQGTLLWDGADELVAKIAVGETKRHRDVQAVDIPPVANENKTHGHASVIHEFLDAIEQGRAPETASDDNLKTLAMVFAAIDSARTKQRLSIAS